MHLYNIFMLRGRKPHCSLVYRTTIQQWLHTHCNQLGAITRKISHTAWSEPGSWSKMSMLNHTPLRRANRQTAVPLASPPIYSCIHLCHHNLVESIWNTCTYQSRRADATMSDRQSVLSELHPSPRRDVRRPVREILSVRRNDSTRYIADAAT